MRRLVSYLTMGVACLGFWLVVAGFVVHVMNGGGW